MGERYVGFRDWSDLMSVDQLAKPRGTPGGKPALPPQHNSGTPGFVYFIQEDRWGPVKIGWALDPYRRLGELQIGSSRPLHLIGLVAGSKRDERRLHADVAQYRLRGEWFDLPPDVLSQITENWPVQP